MLPLNKLIIQQSDIFLAPGSYFHSDFNGDNYHQLPLPLQQRHNQKLIEKYALPMPENRTLLLPKVLSTHWKQLPAVAIYLGLLLQTESPPWSGKSPSTQMLHAFFRDSLKPNEILDDKTTLVFISYGAAQILSCLAPFGKAYTLRANYMFSQATQKLMSTHHKVMLPWNIIEETCHYVRKNTMSRNQKYENTTND